MEAPLPPPSGFTTTQQRAIGVNSAFMAFVVVIMAIRLFTRLAISQALGSDDVLMLFGALTTIGLSVTTIIAVKYGVGRLILEIPLENYETMLLAVWNTRLFYCIAMGFVKLGLLALYLRLDARKPMRWAVYVLMFSVISVSVAGLIVSIIGCDPPEVFWKEFMDPQAMLDKCIDQEKLQAFWDSCGAIVILTDVSIWAAPIPMVWNLNLPRRQKYALSGIFLLGVLSVAAGCVRFYYVRLLADEEEQFYYLADSLNWCAVELYVAMVCGSTSSLRAFAKRFFPALLGSYGRSGMPGQAGFSDEHPSLRLDSLGHKGKSSTMISSRKRDKFQLDLSPTNSQEAIVASDGIMLRTEVRQDKRGVEDDESEFRYHAR